MDMDLVIIFGFVATLVLIITAGIILFPISRKLGLFLEQAARERAERIAGGIPTAHPDPTNQQMLDVLTNLEGQMGELAERQAFTERLLEQRVEPAPANARED